MADDSSLSLEDREPAARPSRDNISESAPPAIVASSTNSTSASSTAGSGNSETTRTVTMVFRLNPVRGSSVGAVRPLLHPGEGPPMVPFQFNGMGVTPPTVTSMPPTAGTSSVAAPTATPTVVAAPAPTAATAANATSTVATNDSTFRDRRHEI